MALKVGMDKRNRLGRVAGAHDRVTAAVVLPQTSTMPALHSPRQPDTPPATPQQRWLQRADTRDLLQACQREVAADIARSSGRYGLLVHPQVPLEARLITANLHTSTHLQRRGRQFDGDLRCDESALPMADDSLALIYLGFAFELSSDPVGLAAECARLLEPEGRLLVLGLNPWSPAHLRWLGHGLHSWSPEALRPLLTGLGLDILQCRYLGGLWSGGDATALDAAEPASATVGNPLRCAFLLEARRREPGLTPLRAAPARVATAQVGAG